MIVNYNNLPPKTKKMVDLIVSLSEAECRGTWTRLAAEMAIEEKYSLCAKNQPAVFAFTRIREAFISLEMGHIFVKHNILLKHWIMIIKAFGLFDEEIEQELFCFTFGDKSETAS